MNRIKGIRANALRDLARYKESGSYWQDSIPYDQNNSLNEKNKVLSDQLFKSLKLDKGYKQKQKQKDFEILLANLFHQSLKPISISLNEKDWKKTRYNRSSYSTIKEMLSVFNKSKYIEMKKGFYFEEGSRMTRIAPTDKLLEYFPEYNTSVVYNPIELVLLKDSKGKLKEYKDTIETHRIRAILIRLNTVNSKADIRCQNYKLNASLVAIFIEKFTWYGRLHTKGFRHYQGLSGEDREEITINGNPRIELDYSGLHPKLLYAEEGIQYRRDPYSIIDRRPELRPFLKEILLCMLNAKDEISAEKAANNWLHLNPSKREILVKLGITRARPLIDKFKVAHEPIAKYFCKGKDTGMRIMNKDSKIALDVANHFAKQNIPILCIHDSFIVQEQYREELFEVMDETYHKHTGFYINIK